MPATIDLNDTITSLLPAVARTVEGIARGLPSFVSREDLHSVGRLALVRAVLLNGAADADIERRVCSRVRSAVLDYLRSQDPLGRRLRQRVRAIREFRERVSTDEGREVQSGEIARALGLRISKVREAERTAAIQFCDASAPDAEALMDESVGCPAERAQVRDLSRFVLSALGKLTERDNVVIRGFYLEGKSHSELARATGLTAERVRQIRIVALQRLRAACTSEMRNPHAPFVGV